VGARRCVSTSEQATAWTAVTSAALMSEACMAAGRARCQRLRRRADTESAKPVRNGRAARVEGRDKRTAPESLRSGARLQPHRDPRGGVQHRKQSAIHRRRLTKRLRAVSAEHSSDGYPGQPQRAEARRRRSRDAAIQLVEGQSRPRDEAARVLKESPAPRLRRRRAERTDTLLSEEQRRLTRVEVSRETAN